MEHPSVHENIRLVMSTFGAVLCAALVIAVAPQFRGVNGLGFLAKLNPEIVPGAAQIVSAVQCSVGDHEGGLQTQKNFARKCPLVAGYTASLYHAAGDHD